MVLQKRLDYGSRGYQVPPMPHIPSSARGKRTARRRKNEMCAFDLLASVAGTLLTDRENLSNLHDINGVANCAITKKFVKQEQFDEVPPLKNVGLEKESCNGCSVGCDSVFPRQANLCSAENSSTRKKADSRSESLTARSNVLVRDSLISCTKSGEFGSNLRTIPEDDATGICYPGSARSVEGKEVEQAGPQMIKSERDGDAAALYGLAGSMDLDAKPPALVSSDSSSEVPLYRHGTHRNSSSFCLDRMQLAADRDDDENSSGCTHPSTTGNKAFMAHRVGDRRIRKLFASRLRKAARNRICGEISNSELKLDFRGKKMSSTRHRAQRTMFKRKKLMGRHLMASSSNRGILTEASGTSFSMEGQKPLYGSEDYRVKLSIKSFNVPELFIEIPENATVGSLKRTVMDAVTAIIEGGLRVGVLLQGKNVRDDNKTLRQAGICNGEKLDTIGFTLESEAAEAPPQIIAPEDRNFTDAGDIVETSARKQSEETFLENRVPETIPQPIPTSPSNCRISDPGSVHSPIEVAAQESSANSKAIIAAHPLNVEALAVVPFCKSKRSDIGQRRMRRPFSVAEVEALVQAVEKLGTGRWRDVKIRAFDNAKHRTYVDLKDKWKTLVHTANISPQQRRGEPVPQELLDRVLSAQAYWSQQQAKLQDRSCVPEMCPA